MAQVGLRELAKVLNVSPRRVQQLAVEGVIPRAAARGYDLAACATGYIRFLQDGGKGTGRADVSRERTRLLKAQADGVERANRVALGELVPIAEYRRRMSAMITQARQQLLQLPGRAAPQLEGEPRAVIKTKLYKLTCAALAALSEGPAEDGNATTSEQA